MWGPIYVFLNIIAVAMMVYAIVGARKSYMRLRVASERRKAVLPWLLGLGILIGSLVIGATVFSDPWSGFGKNLQFAMVILTSLSISGIWMWYVLSLDVFERESKSHIAFAFIAACITTFFVFPLSGWYSGLTGHALNGHPVNDFLYCVVGIGLIEELVKIIPFVILLRFTKAVNEPFDYLLYASVSALGFAFVENTLYLDNFEHYVTNARALFASVAHMTFSSTVAYVMLIFRFKYHRKTGTGLLTGLAIAALAHGFYNFWLINEAVSNYAFITMLFFLGTVHLWTIMKNNALNLSPFFEPTVELRNDRIKGVLAIGLLSVSMLAFLVLSARYGFESSLRFLLNEFYAYAFIILYLVMGLSNYDLVRAYLSPLKIPFRMIFFPGLDVKRNYSGQDLVLEDDHRILNNAERDILQGRVLSGKLLEKLAIRFQPEWYLMKLDEPIRMEGYLSRYVVVSERDESPPMDNPKGTILRVMLIRSAEQEFTASKVESYRFAGYYKGRLL